MLYLVELPDSIRYLESRLDEIFEKTDMIDAVAGRVEGLPIQELLARVNTLEANTNVGITVNYERGDNRIPHQSNTENTWRRPNNRSPPKRPLSCFICGKPHLARECPNKVDFHAFQASLIADSDDKPNQDEDEAGLIDGGERTRIGAIKYLSSLQKKSRERNSRAQEEPPSVEILLGALEKPGETVRKDTLRVDRSRGVKHLPKSDDRPRQCRVRTTKAKGLEKNCVTRHEAYEFPVMAGRKALFCAKPDERTESCGKVPPRWVVERRRHSVEREPRVSGHLQWFKASHDRGAKSWVRRCDQDS
uniref:Uncharacterized protein n=1 Tax=Cucumis melo TaxID=3656 RepID=A0A9I9E5B3_CUCME